MADFPGEVVVLLARKKSGRKDALRTGAPEWTLPN